MQGAAALVFNDVPIRDRVELEFTTSAKTIYH